VHFLNYTPVPAAEVFVGSFSAVASARASPNSTDKWAAFARRDRERERCNEPITHSFDDGARRKEGITTTEEASGFSFGACDEGFLPRLFGRAHLWWLALHYHLNGIRGGRAGGGGRGGVERERRMRGFKQFLVSTSLPPSAFPFPRTVFLLLFIKSNVTFAFSLRFLLSAIARGFTSDFRLQTSPWRWLRAMPVAPPKMYTMTTGTRAASRRGPGSGRAGMGACVRSFVLRPRLIPSPGGPSSPSPPTTTAATTTTARGLSTEFSSQGSFRGPAKGRTAMETADEGEVALVEPGQ